MEGFGPEDDREIQKNDVIRQALESAPGMIDLALMSIEGDRSLIVPNAQGVGREVVFEAPEFPETYKP